jgi:phosphoglycolate phosphatase/putative hydrolase of the HAD superfamily
MDATQRVRGVLFDLDGTLYRQRPMRALMAAELGLLAISRPLRAPIVWRVLSEFRKAQSPCGRRPATVRPSISSTSAARRTGMPIDQVEEIVAEWMIERPLKHLPRCRAEGLVPAARFSQPARRQARGALGLPRRSKLKALGIGGRFSVVLCAADPEVGRFKPHPRGFLVPPRLGGSSIRPKCSSSATGRMPTRGRRAPPACRASSLETATTIIQRLRVASNR